MIKLVEKMDALMEALEESRDEIANHAQNLARIKEQLAAVRQAHRTYTQRTVEWRNTLLEVLKQVKSLCGNDLADQALGQVTLLIQQIEMIQESGYETDGSSH